MKYILLTVIAILSTGCMTNPEISKKFSAPELGCLPKDITIHDETATMDGMHTWIASSNDKRYYCTYHSGDGAKCKELQK